MTATPLPPRPAAAAALAGFFRDVLPGLLADVRAAGGIDRARQKAAALADEAISALAALPPSPHRDALALLARLSADRSS